MNIQVCPACGIHKFDSQFRWSFKGDIASDDAVFSKVCSKAKKPGCINETGKFDKNLDWKPITVEFIDALIEGSSLALQQLEL
jgi:hypothetical protein